MASNDNEHKPTPRSRTTNDDVPRRGIPGWLLAAFLVLAVVSVGGFALWRQLATPAPEPVAQQEPQLTQEELDVQGRVERYLDELTPEQRVAQLFVVRPESITGVDTAVAAGDTTRRAITDCPVGGICYFAANLVSPEQTREMLRNTQNYAKDACGLPMFLCVDEEGGTVSRVAANEAFGVDDVGDMADIGATQDPEKARAAANEVGSYLAGLGFNVDFAPVADIVASEEGVMYSRSFGGDPQLVANMVTAQVEGFARANVLCAAKHFPGIGGAEGDSHNGRIYSYRTAEEMSAWELVPFRAAIAANVPMVMVGHLSCMGLADGAQGVPASLSKHVIGDLLRGELGYQGLVITDSFEMSALDGVCTPDEQAVRAIEAGADLVLMPSDFQRAYQGLLGAVRQGTISQERIDESVRRIIRAKIALL